MAQAIAVARKAPTLEAAGAVRRKQDPAAAAVSPARTAPAELVDAAYAVRQKQAPAAPKGQTARAVRSARAAPAVSYPEGMAEEAAVAAPLPERAGAAAKGVVAANRINLIPLPEAQAWPVGRDRELGPRGGVVPERVAPPSAAARSAGLSAPRSPA